MKPNEAYTIARLIENILKEKINCFSSDDLIHHSNLPVNIEYRAAKTSSSEPQSCKTLHSYCHQTEIDTNEFVFSEWRNRIIDQILNLIKKTLQEIRDKKGIVFVNPESTVCYYHLKDESEDQSSHYDSMFINVYFVY